MNVEVAYEDNATQALLEMSERFGSQIMTQMRRYSSGESFALHHLLRNDGFSYPSELLEEAGTSSARIAAILKSLEKKGLVIRDVDPDDRRKTVVTITEEGRQRTTDEFKVMSGYFQEVFRRLGEEDTEEFLRIIRRFLELSASVYSQMSQIPTDSTEQPPPNNTTQTPKNNNNTTQTPPNYTTQTPPNSETQTPTDNTTQTPPNSNTTQTPNNNTEQTPPNNYTEQTPTNNYTEQPPTNNNHKARPSDD